MTSVTEASPERNGGEGVGGVGEVEEENGTGKSEEKERGAERKRGREWRGKEDGVRGRKGAREERKQRGKKVKVYEKEERRGRERGRRERGGGRELGHLVNRSCKPQ